MMIVLIILGTWGLSRIDLNLGEMMAEIRRYVQCGEEDAKAEAAEALAEDG